MTILFFETPFLHEKTVKKSKKKDGRKVLFFTFFIVFKNSGKKYFSSLFLTNQKQRSVSPPNIQNYGRKLSVRPI
jgi:hypothetical protein